MVVLVLGKLNLSRFFARMAGWAGYKVILVIRRADESRPRKLDKFSRARRDRGVDAQASPDGAACVCCS